MVIKRDLFTTDIYIFDMSSLKELHDRYPKNLIAKEFGIDSLNLLEFFQKLKIKL